MRRVIVLVLILGALAPAGPAAQAAPASAATGAVQRVLIHRDDPFMDGPVSIRLDALDALDADVAFTGTVTLQVGKHRVTTPVSGDGTQSIGTELDTSALPTGEATLTAVVRGAAGRAVRVVRAHFLTVEAPLEVAPFGCAAFTRAGGEIRFAVTRMAGEPIRTPNSRTVPLLPYIAPSGRLSLMVDEDWRPLSTSGTLTVLRGTRRVAVIRLPVQVRRLVFGVRWHPAVAPGTYSTALALTDPAGRVYTATGSVTVTRRGILPCGT